MVVAVDEVEAELDQVRPGPDHGVELVEPGYRRDEVHLRSSPRAWS